jgi:hypothetical protein
MGILEDAKSTLVHLAKVNAAATGAAEANAIESLRSALMEMLGPISLLSVNASILKQEGVELSPIPKLKDVIAAAKSVQDRFVENPKATTLRQGTRWKSLSDKLDTLALSGRSTQAQDWSRFFEANYFGGLPPAQRFAKLAATPENANAIKRYQAAYQAFSKYRSQPPVGPTDFNTLRALSKQLTEIIFQEDVPDDVKKFLDATSSGAALDLLTTDVLKWLRENKLLGNYVVRASVH